MNYMELSLLPNSFSICRLPASADIPLWPMQGSFFSVTRTAEELSIVCEERYVRREEPAMKVEDGWRCLKLRGPIPFEMTGVIASLTKPLAENNLSVFVVSTFDTDYLLVRSTTIVKAIDTLRKAG